MDVGIKERLDSTEEQQRSAVDNQLANVRVSMPGIIVNFNPGNQTASVQPAVSENIQIGDKPTEATNLPVLTDVPVQFPRAGGYCITFPVKKGDECLLVFGDMCMDGWWQSGGVQDQMETRRHDLSDGFAIMGITSVPNAVKDYSANTLQIKNEGGACIEIDGSTINITADTVNITGTLTVSDETVTAGIPFTSHVHGNVMGGGDKTSVPAG